MGPEPVWTGAENLAPHRDSIPGLFTPWGVAILTALYGRVQNCYRRIFMADGGSDTRGKWSDLRLRQIPRYSVIISVGGP